MLTSKEIRSLFLQFFESKGHKIVPSAPLVIKNDPTLMFTNAGMNQFKDLFLGNAPVKYPRIANSQKCLRVSGKHNDLEEVGIDTYHHTMFEMLGNWSFGDYFKKEAIEWAWELLTEVYKLPKDRLYVTVFGGDEAEGLAFDREAAEYWSAHIAKDRILSGSKKDNFWEMGDTGPCGPCSEIHIDLRPDEARKALDGKELVNTGHPQVIEIWNLVFMEFNRKANGSLEKLPAQHVDTGMGFERLTMALQGKTSNYDTDIFQPLIKKIEQHTGIAYKSNEKTDIAMRVIADHVRAVAFAIADGQLPSNTGAGYVIRRILRRAIRYAYSSLNIQSPFIYTLVDVLAAEMGDFFPEIRESAQFVARVIREEEQTFIKTIDSGLNRLEEVIRNTQGKVVDGEKLFELYDTYGFPLDLTTLILRERGYSADQEGFNREMQRQKERSRAAAELLAGDWVEIRNGGDRFVGYDTTELETEVARFRKVEAKDKTFYQIALVDTPFYPEGGGQVGDTGVLYFGDERIEVYDTKKENGIILHLTRSLPQDITLPVKAVVNVEKRKATARNHSATHLLHYALRKVLGTHVEQKGSLVAPDYLRFDFSHFAKMNDEELEKVEDLVNQLILDNIPLDEYREIEMEAALEMGAIALFGEKYGERVRAIKFGPSVELCGGTHVASTGAIGLLKITQETAIAAGVRRIEAVTGFGFLKEYRDQNILLTALKGLLKHPKDPATALQNILEERHTLQKKVENYARLEVEHLFEKLSGEVERLDTPILAERVPLDSAQVKDLAFRLKQRFPKGCFALGYVAADKPGIAIAVGDDAVKMGINAGAIVKEVASFIRGGGGGQPHFATAGGSDPHGLETALKVAREKLTKGSAQ
ncbi:alanine--tRNA ligase [Thermaurantimonas aggregans]|uniref:Alanine--tRNA ligase n=1 Tax=Thermaurantimonas aggregans TaxID=2173829 RepID=A0A401XNR8_9FLAO|nr:alanine--tRNA ligase [Thermaurantimonas aggregans]MCX8149487.1 alanine--tRNA ligase [Thermaurantimonas aggregans]GCD78661.1 alanine--tRNA ligase [Thermaurantimonas aggregans]